MLPSLWVVLLYFCDIALRAVSQVHNSQAPQAQRFWQLWEVTFHIFISSILLPLYYREWNSIPPPANAFAAQLGKAGS